MARVVIHNHLPVRRTNDAIKAGRTYPQIANELQNSANGWIRAAGRDPVMAGMWNAHAERHSKARRWALEKGKGVATEADIQQIQSMLREGIT